MSKENEFSETLLHMRTALDDMEFSSNILNYELGYIKVVGNNAAAYKSNIANIRIFKYRILPAIEKICDNVDKLRLVSLKAKQQVADLQGQGRG